MIDYKKYKEILQQEKYDKTLLQQNNNGPSSPCQNKQGQFIYGEEDLQELLNEHKKQKNSKNSLKSQIESIYQELKLYLVEDFDPKEAFYCLKKLSFLYNSSNLEQQEKDMLIIDLQLLESIVINIHNYNQYENGLDLQSAALWFLANTMALLSEEKIMEFLEMQPVLDIFYEFLIFSEDEHNLEQTLWTLANVMSHYQVRDFALGNNLVLHITEFVKKITDKNNDHLFTLSINRTLTWLICNICRAPSPNFSEITSHFLPYLATMMHIQDEQILRDSCFAISNMNFLNNEIKYDTYQQIQEILSYRVGERAVLLTQNDNKEVQVSSLILLGKLTYGNSQQLQYLIDQGILYALKKLLMIKDSLTRKKEVLFCLSNICANCKDILDQVIECGILDLIKNLIQQTDNKLILEESLMIIVNASFGCDQEIAQWLIDQNFLYILASHYEMKVAAGDSQSSDIQEGLEAIIYKSSDSITTNEVQNVLKSLGLNQNIISMFFEQQLEKIKPNNIYIDEQQQQQQQEDDQEENEIQEHYLGLQDDENEEDESLENDGSH